MEKEIIGGVFLFPNLCLVDLQNKTDIEYKSWLIKQINKIF